MKTYYFKALNNHGEFVSGELKANKQQEVIQALVEQNHTVIEIYPKKSERLRKWAMNLMLLKASTKELMLFSDQLSTMLISGIPLSDALKALAENYKTSRLSKHIANLVTKINAGESLSKAMSEEKIFPDLYVAMIYSGEESGTLDEVLVRMGRYFEKEIKLFESIKQAVTYPLVLLLVSILVIYIIIARVIPEFIQIFSAADAELPFFTRGLFGVGVLVNDYWLVILLFTIVFIIGCKICIQYTFGQKVMSQIMLNLPIIGDIFKKHLLTRFVRTLATLVESGLPITIALNLVRKTCKDYCLEKTTSEIIENIEKGGSISESFSSRNFFPLMAQKMLAVGEETGTFEKMLNKIGDYYERENNYKLNQLSQLIEPILILLMMMLVGFLVLSVTIPMMNLWQFF